MSKKNVDTFLSPNSEKLTRSANSMGVYRNSIGVGETTGRKNVLYEGKSTFPSVVRCSVSWSVSLHQPLREDTEACLHLGVDSHSLQKNPNSKVNKHLAFLLLCWFTHVLANWSLKLYWVGLHVITKFLQTVIHKCLHLSAIWHILCTEICQHENEQLNHFRRIVMYFLKCFHSSLRRR